MDINFFAKVFQIKKVIAMKGRALADFNSNAN